MANAEQRVAAGIRDECASRFEQEAIRVRVDRPAGRIVVRFELRHITGDDPSAIRQYSQERAESASQRAEAGAAIRSAAPPDRDVRDTESPKRDVLWTADVVRRRIESRG